MYGFTMYHRPHRVKLNGFFMFGADWTAGFDFNWADKFRFNTYDDRRPACKYRHELKSIALRRPQYETR